MRAVTVCAARNFFRISQPDILPVVTFKISFRRYGCNITVSHHLRVSMTLHTSLGMECPPLGNIIDLAYGMLIMTIGT